VAAQEVGQGDPAEATAEAPQEMPSVHHNPA